MKSQKSKWRWVGLAAWISLSGGLLVMMSYQLGSTLIAWLK